MGVVNSFSRIGGLISPFFAVALVQASATYWHILSVLPVALMPRTEASTTLEPWRSVCSLAIPTWWRGSLRFSAYAQWLQ